MNAEDIINEVIAKGQSEGLSSLSRTEKSVFLISEAEVYCDMNGIDSLLDHYPRETLVDCALAFRAVGAADIADALSAIVGPCPYLPYDLLYLANKLIIDRTGYDYGAIAEWMTGST